MNNKRIKINLNNIRVGKMLEWLFIQEMGLTQAKLARAIKVPKNRISEIVSGKRSITADTDYRLCKFYGISQGHFLEYQNGIEMRITREKLKKLKIDSYKKMKKHLVVPTID